MQVADVWIEPNGADGRHDLVEQDGVSVAEEGVGRIAGWTSGTAVKQTSFVEQVGEAAKVAGGSTAFHAL